MGLHAHLLEPRWCTPQLLSLHSIHRQPRPCRVPLEPLPSDPPLHHLPVCVLDLGHGKLAKEHVQSTGKGRGIEPKDIPAITLESS